MIEWKTIHHITLYTGILFLISGIKLLEINYFDGHKGYFAYLNNMEYIIIGLGIWGIALGVYQLIAINFDPKVKRAKFLINDFLFYCFHRKEWLKKWHGETN